MFRRLSNPSSASRTSLVSPFYLVAIALMFGFRCSAAVAQLADHPNLAIFNARLFSGDALKQNAVAIRGERIVAVGSNEEIESMCDVKTLRIDAKLASVTPGINDSHVHFLSGSLSLSQVNLLEVTSVEAVQNAISKFAKDHPEKKWIEGRGWYYGVFPGGMPNKTQLDNAVSDRPAAMRCYDGHTTWVNSKALQIAKIDRSTPDPSNGVIVRDSDGNPTGVLLEGAQSLVDSIIPEPTRSEKLDALKAGVHEALRYGVTSVQEAGIGEKELSLMETLRASGDLSIRITVALEAHPGLTEEELDDLERLRKKFASFPIHAMKMYADGVIESRTAAVIDPYANSNTRGRPEYIPEDMNRIVSMLDRRGWQLMIHATGDGGIRMAIDAIELATKTNPAPAKGRRHRIEHIESISRQDMARFGTLQLIASMQPFHADPNSNLFEVWAANLGEERASRAWCWRSLQSSGAKLAFGSDWPVVGIDPRLGFHTALTRQTSNGQPPSGFIPAERLPLQDVLNAYTQGAAFAEFAEDNKGSIQPGMLADLVIWDRDLFACKVDAVHEANVKATILGGKMVYSDENRLSLSR